MKHLRPVLLICFLSLQALCAADIVLQQSFEAAASDNWSYTAGPAPYSNNNPYSLWNRDDDILPALLPLPDATGDYVWTLENTNYKNTDAHTMTFQTVDLSAYTGNLSLHFSYYTFDYENQVDGSWSGDFDELGYYVEYDNGSIWTNYTEMNMGSNAWVEVNVSIPSDADYVRFRLAGKNDRWQEIAAFDYIYLLQDDQPLPVELSEFTADYKNGYVQIDWTTESETENAEFLLYRGDKLIARVPGAGTTSEVHAYSVTDDTVLPGKSYDYRLCDKNFANEISDCCAPLTVVTADMSSQTAENFVIYAAYPNPFNPMTRIDYDLKAADEVSFSIFDLHGNCIETINEGFKTAGTHHLIWDAAAHPAGIYVLRGRMNGKYSSQKLLLLK